MAYHVLVITHDLIADKMAGPAIRCWELASQLSTICQVTLTSKLPVSRESSTFKVLSFERSASELMAQAAAADILIVQGWMLHDYPVLTTLGKFLVVDLYDPFVFESYPYFESRGRHRDETYRHFVQVMNEQMVQGDFFVCASERQRDMWLGRFCTLARLTPELFAADPSMARLIDLVPFGLPSSEPRSLNPVMREVVPGIGSDDFILLWGGGIWNWFDPLTVIRAVAELSRERSDIKLFFMGTQHPNPEIPEMEMTNQAIALAEELGVLGSSVFFNYGWVSYDDRQAYLAEASAGISAHFDSLETRFSFRTRVLDYLWAGLPVLTTCGDGMAELVAQNQLGAVIPYQDVPAWKAAIVALADDPARVASVRSRVRGVGAQFQWAEVAKPLLAYCAAPYRSPRAVPGSFASPPKGLLGKSVQTIRQEGVLPFLSRGARYLSRVLARP
ncbi:D-inositol-3-phosphate glycosyltransferase [compost metagenome]